MTSFGSVLLAAARLPLTVVAVAPPPPRLICLSLLSAYRLAAFALLALFLVRDLCSIALSVSFKVPCLEVDARRPLLLDNPNKTSCKTQQRETRFHSVKVLFMNETSKKHEQFFRLLKTLFFPVFFSETSFQLFMVQFLTSSSYTVLFITFSRSECLLV